MLTRLFDFNAGDITAGVIGGLIVALLLALPLLLRRGVRWVGVLNARWGLALNRAELQRIRQFLEDRGALRDYLLQRILIGICLLGVALMFMPVAAVTRADWSIAALLWFAIGMAIYVLTLSALATIHHLRHAPEKTIERLQRRIEEFEKKLASH